MNTFLKPLSKGIILGMWVLLMMTPTLFAAQTWVVAEVFTATTCPHCPSARSALNNMYEDTESYPHLIPIIWQGDGDHRSPNFGTRRGLYQVGGIPHAQFGGNVQVVGGGAGAPNAYSQAYNMVEPRDAPMEISASITANAQNELVVSADITMEAAITTPNNNVVFVLTEDLTGEMDPDYFASAKAYYQQQFDLTEPEQQDTVTKEFPIEEGWNLSRMKGIVMVQSFSQGNPVIHQAGAAAIGDLQPVTVTGRVLGSDAPDGINGATVRMSGAGEVFQTNSGDNGNFTLENVLGHEDGIINYELRVSQEGYESHVSDRQVFDENLDLGNITLHESVYTTVSGRVISPDSPDGLPDATVRLEREEENYQQNTGADGSFSIENVRTTQPGVNYQVIVTKDGYTTYSENENIPGEPVNLGNIQITEVPYSPRDVVAIENEEQDAVEVTWRTPGPSEGEEQWLHWDSGQNDSAIGNPDNPIELSAAARFTPAQLEELDAQGLYITAIRFFPRLAQANYTLKVWRGGGADPYNAGQEIASQPVEAPNIGQWNEIDLNNPVEIHDDEEIWFGYHVRATAAGFPAGTDAGPAENGYGDLIYTNQWTTLFDISNQLNYNWNIQGYAGQTRGDRSISLASSKTDMNQDQDFRFTSSNQQGQYQSNIELMADPNTNTYSQDAGTRSLRRGTRNSSSSNQRLNVERYDVYRFLTEHHDNPELWTDLGNTTDTTFVDEGWGDPLAAGEYQYAVVAVYAGDVESDPALSNTLYNRMFSTVEVTVTTNSEDPSEGAIVTLENHDGNPDHQYNADVSEEGVATFSNVWKGDYTLSVRLSGFERYRDENISIDQDLVQLQAMLIERLADVVGLEWELYNDNNVSLEWHAPGTVLATPQWIHWDSGQNEGNSVGTGGPAQFISAARFTPDDLEELDVIGLHLTSIKFFPMVEDAQYTLKVWRGGTDTPSYDPGAEVHSQPVAEFQNQAWNEIDLEGEGILITPDEELWFGYHVDTPGGHPAGVDPGPANNGRGNIMFFNNEWTTLLSVSQTLNYNWNLQAYAGADERSDAANISRSNLKGERDAEDTRALLGYKIIRNETVLETEYEGVTYNDTSLSVGGYVYTVIAQYTTGESEGEQTEEIIVLSTDDEVAMTPLVTELRGNYPNPFNPDTKINFSLANEDNVKLEIYNLKGQRIRTLVDEKMDSGYHSVVWDGRNDNNSEVSSGIYFYRMKSGSYSTSKKMILMK